MKMKSTLDNLKRIIYLLSLISCVFCYLKSKNSVGISWTVSLIPLMIAVGLIVPSVYIYMSTSCSKLQNLSVGILSFISYSLCLSLLVFILIIGLKLDETITSSWYSIFIPFWYAVFSYTCFCGFMFPGMMDPTVNLQREAWTLVGFVVGTIASSILIAAWLNGNKCPGLWFALGPGIITAGISLVGFLHSRLGPNEPTKELVTQESVFYVAILTLFITLSVSDGDSSRASQLVEYILIGVIIITLWAVDEWNDKFNRHKDISEYRYNSL
jgi:hypothetical protein